MKPMLLRSWLIGTVFSSCTFGLMGTALAQTAPAATPPPQSQSLTTIKVYARKKVENLQKVPLSVTAITAKTLQQAHVENLHDIIALTPGVNVADFGAEAGTTITIRGDTDQTFGINVPDVATFVDGAYVREPAALNIAAAPLSDVEVIKGPVSALYGRDAFAGVIDYNFARPSDTPSANISETAGDYGKSELKGDISGPLFGDKVVGEVFGDFDTFNGTYKDNVSGAQAGGDQKKDIGALLDFNWTDNFTTHLDFYYGYDYFNNAAVEALKPNCGDSTEVAPDGAAILAPNLYCGTVKTNGTVQVGNNPAAGNAGNERRTFYGSMDNAAKFDWGTIDSITGASQVDEQAFQLFDGSSTGEPYELANIGTPTVSNGKYADEHSYYGQANNTGDVSEELRYSSPQNQALRYGAGAFFYSEERYYASGASVSEEGIPAGDTLDIEDTFGDTAFFETPTGSIGPNINAAKLSTDEEAGFANAEYDLLPNLTVSSQYRYSWILEKNNVTSYEYGDVPGVTTGTEPHLAEQYFSTNESIRWFPIPNQMLYFSFANGEKPGGFNNTYANQYASFGSESNTSFEGGFKTQFLDGRMQLDGAAYHINTSNLQEYVPLPNGSEAIANANGQTSNTGFEIDARAVPVDGLTVTGGFNYNNPTFDNGAFDADDAYNCVEIASCAAKEITVHGLLELPVAGHTVPLTSKETLSGTAEYDFTVADHYPAYVRGDYSFQSSQFTDDTNLTSIPASGILNLFAGISKGRYTASVYVKNVTNDEAPNFFQYDATLDYFNDVPVVSLLPGRTFAFTIAAKF
jgi:iron complex outermembrane receptor protein